MKRRKAVRGKPYCFAKAGKRIAKKILTQLASAKTKRKQRKQNFDFQT